jgi:purine-nucleoside/S-methyl-5'-thioadenosine phosphorylase / adenosine deaminase
MDTPVESFPALAALPGVIHGFTGRVPGIDVKVEREHALARLEQSHAEVREALGLGDRVFITAQQVHGAGVAIVDVNTPTPVPDVDGLVTADPRVCLGIYVADCGAVFLADPKRRVIGLLHSGRKGTEQGITRVAIEQMIAEFGCDPAQMIVQLGPCIRPPHYEIDFAAEIVRQAREAGVREVHDCGICTGQNVDRYYSYRVEKGRTGRMLAKLALA